MGPRSFDRGNQIASATITPNGGLQWGRDLLIAETDKAVTFVNQDLMLQWGRDLLIAETQAQARIFLTLSLLQWGRDLLIAETCTL